MARGVEKLNALAVRRAKEPGLYADGKNLYLRIGEGAAKSWVFRFMLDGKSREMGIGSAYDVTLGEARERARGYRKQLQDGVDPIDRRRDERLARRAERERAKGAMTFKECAERYIAAHEASWRNPKHAAQWPSTLETYAYSVIGALPVQEVDTAFVLRVLEPIWNQKPETAGRVRGRIESVLDWATSRGHREGTNPAAWRGHLANLLPSKSKIRPVAHHAALPYSQIGAFMAELQQQEGIAARTLEFTILTATRTGEAIGARWDEFDLTKRVWTIPAKRMKAHKEHKVPLSDAAFALIDALPREGDFVFPGGRAGRPLSNMAMTMVLRRLNRADITVHGFRSTFRDWAAERSNFPNQVCEMALAHTISAAVEAAYRRGDLYRKRAQLMAAWAKFTAVSAPAGNVVPLRRQL
jgi:integrase